MRSRGPIFVLALAACAAWAQAPADKETAEMTSKDAPALFKSKVNVVLVPVVVRDDKGRALSGLTKDDFLLFDGGKQQLITSFTVEKPGGRLSAEPAPPPSAPAPALEGDAAPHTAPERFVAYLFDDVHLDMRDLVRTRDAVERQLGSSMAPAERAAIFTTSGRTTLDFTDDLLKIHDTLLRLRPKTGSLALEQQCPDISYYMADMIENKQDRDAMNAAMQEAIICRALDPNDPATPRMASDEVHMVARRALTFGDEETRLALRVIRDVIRRIASMPGQRTIILVSPGFYVSFGNAPENKSEIMDRAIRANVIINALDARGVYTDDLRVDKQVFDATVERLKTRYERDSTFIQGEILGEFADATGGTFVRNTNDLEGGFKRLAAAPDTWYVVGFSPQNLKLDGKFHRLKVALKMPKGTSIQARRGYYAPRQLENPEEQQKREIEEALFSREELAELPVRMQTQFFKTNDDNAKLAILVHLDLKGIRFRKADGRNHDLVTFVYGLFDRNGNYVNAIKKDLTLRLLDQTLAAKLASGITVRSSMDVKPGSYSIRLVVRDSEGQLTTAQNGAVEIPY